MEVKGKKENDLILRQLKGTIHQQKLEVLSQVGEGVLQLTYQDTSSNTK